jgi:hypothetical protein
MPQVLIALVSFAFIIFTNYVCNFSNIIIMIESGKYLIDVWVSGL